MTTKAEIDNIRKVLRDANSKHIATLPEAVFNETTGEFEFGFFAERIRIGSDGVYEAVDIAGKYHTGKIDLSCFAR